MITDFSVFSADQSNAEKIAIAVRDEILADDILSSFVDQRVNRLSDPFAGPDIQLPMIVIFAESESREFLTNKEAEVTLPLSVGLFYDEDRDSVSDTERTVQSYINRLNQVLVGNALLENTQFGITPLVLRLDQMQTVGYAITPEESGATIYLEVQFDYKYIVDAETGVKQ